MAVKRGPGERIVELCKTYSLTRETLAERSGLDIELIRRIEEGYIPDLAPLLKISRALGVRLGTLLDDHEELGPVITRSGQAGESSRFITGLPGSTGGGARTGAGSPVEAAAGGHQGLIFRTLAADKAGRHMEPFIVDIDPNAEQAKSTHEGEEFIHVLSGKLSLEYGGDSYALSGGDSVYYDSIVPHRLSSGDGKPLRILAVIYSPA
ncbi:MAG: cupin domain-containing protein [Treponema sp.]|jgi:transcriptional regulator with XRE-family HTH domain/quercetin dioxygenase-like cupin family protein|nr:cupin domain-containing protein [Treponema sp.]